MNIMFVSSGVVLPYQIGADLANADKLCSDSAAKAFLGGTRWKAWLATTKVSAPTHIGASTTGWIRIDGRPFATNMANLVAGKIFYPPSLTEANTFRTTEYAVLTGADQSGTAVLDGTCGDWTSLTGSVSVGEATSTSSDWTHSFWIAGNTCGTSAYPVYCFQNDSGMEPVPPPVAPSTARHAFVSVSSWLPGGGVSSADAVCQNDAKVAGLANATAYRALLNTTVAATDASRISLSGQPWYRLDGAQLVATASDLGAAAADHLLTSLNVDSTGDYVRGTTFTGSAVAPSSTIKSENCDNWTSTSGTAFSRLGFSNHSGPAWWSGAKQGCDQVGNLYCFER